MTGWLQFGLSVLSALVGGFVGGWTVAFRMGQWRQRIDSKIEEHGRQLDAGTERVRQVPLLQARLDSIDRRLEDGDPHLGQVPVLAAKLDVVIDAINEVKGSVRMIAEHSVTHEECNRRHGDGGYKD